MDRLTIHQDLRGQDTEAILDVINANVESAWKEAGFGPEWSVSTIELTGDSFIYMATTQALRHGPSILAYVRSSALPAFLGWNTRFVPLVRGAELVNG